MIVEERRADTVFGAGHAERQARLLAELPSLLDHHRDRCPAYARWLDAFGHRRGTVYTDLAQLPALPVRSFKSHELRSIGEEEVFRVLTSSGTTGSAVSRIFLDRAAAAAQAKGLASAVSAVIGPARLPMLLLDTKSVTRGSSFSARGAGVLGMMNFGRKHTFALDEAGDIDSGAIRRFLAEFGDGPFLMFGFTFMAWTVLRQMAADIGADLRNGTLIHSGGWKKLQDQAVSAEDFRHELAQLTGLRQIRNFYGMVEQIGTVCFEGPEQDGTLYLPDCAEVIVRDPTSWEPAAIGTPGVLEVLSTLPRTYPGNVLLTEDIGVVDGIDDGSWGGKRFRVLGRLAAAEARGCSDTMGVPR